MTYLKRFLMAVILTVPMLHSAAMADDDGYGFTNPKMPTEKIITGGQPTVADVEKLKAAGVKLIINMRGANERDQSDIKAAAAAAGMRYLNIPITSNNAISAESAKLLDEALASEKDGKVFTHCGSGNRVGAIMALRAYHVEGKTAEEAIAFGKSAGLTRLEGVVKEKLQ